jgi:hypothetical protein
MYHSTETSYEQGLPTILASVYAYLHHHDPVRYQPTWPVTISHLFNGLIKYELPIRLSFEDLFCYSAILIVVTCYL